MSTEIKQACITRAFGKLTEEEYQLAGGKGRMLSQLYNKGYPIPEGFVIFPVAFFNDEISEEAWIQVQTHIKHLRKAYPGVAFAVRSSAVAEDSALASFAGEFETVLNVSDNEKIRTAINTVRKSRHNERVKAYSQARGVPVVQEIAVIIQRLITADISGVLFTADPITSNRNRMTGSYVYGFGDKLVSGEVRANNFIIERLKFKYEGPLELQRFALRLYKLASRLEKYLSSPQDIEWVIAGDKLYILQSRPITTMIGFNPITGEFNDSLTGDFTWSCVNSGEAMPVVMTPFTWSTFRRTYDEMSIIPGYHPVGNIGGRFYQNSTVMVTLLRAQRKNMKDIVKELGGVREEYMENLDQFLTPISGVSTLSVLMGGLRMLRRVRAAMKNLEAFLAESPQWCRSQCKRINEIQNCGELATLYAKELTPRVIDTFWRAVATAWNYGDLVGKLRHHLTEMVSTDDADILLSNVSTQNELLSSLGPVIGLSRVIRGDMSRDDYLEQWGHRGPLEADASIPRPFEDPEWLDKQLETFAKSPVDAEAILSIQQARFEDAWERLRKRYPQQATKLRRRMGKAAEAIRKREAVRSELTRLIWVMRTWARRVGDLKGIGDDIFFLTYEEILKLLHDIDTAIAYIRTRRRTYERYKALPPYPLIICGRFDPFQWAADPNRSQHLFDSHGQLHDWKLQGPSENFIIGMPGSSGRIEGVVRRLDTPDDWDKLEQGEILVTSQTNIGWTLLFPKAGGIVTDIGAPLSHAAIVARELGIPAVVNCGDATTRLRTGDKVKIDGMVGTVEILERRYNAQ